MTQQLATAEPPKRLVPLLVLAGTVVALLWAYWTSLADAARRWSSDPSYSHGYLVPIFAAVLLWLRWNKLAGVKLTPSWWGAPVLALGVGLRFYAAYLNQEWTEGISLLPCLAGVCLLVGGWQAWRWAWPAILFLMFMIPLPYRYAGAMAEPLQRFATIVSTFLLQTLGLPALAEGNVILLSEVEMGIVEACSGLRMLVIFFALSTAVALLLRRPIWEKVLIVMSAVPIALASNVIRITTTGVLHELVSSTLANAVFHDLAGWLMMPLGLGMLWIELVLLKHLLLDPADDLPPEGPSLATLGPPVTPPPAPPARQRRPWQPAPSSMQANPGRRQPPGVP